MMEDKLYQKRDYFFVDNDRSILSDVSFGADYSILVKDSRGVETQILFRVTRNAHLSDINHWIYGQVLNPVTDSYEQVEFRLHKDRPEKDTIAVFPSASPVMF